MPINTFEKISQGEKLPSSTSDGNATQINIHENAKDTSKNKEFFNQCLIYVSNIESGKEKGNVSGVIDQILAHMQKTNEKPNLEQAKKIEECLKQNSSVITESGDRSDNEVISRDQLERFQRLMKNPEEIKKLEEQIIEDFMKNPDSNEWQSVAKKIENGSMDYMIKKIANSVGGLIEKNYYSNSLGSFLKNLDCVFQNV